MVCNFHKISSGYMCVFILTSSNVCVVAHMQYSSIHCTRKGSPEELARPAFTHCTSKGRRGGPDIHRWSGGCWQLHVLTRLLWSYSHQQLSQYLKRWCICVPSHLCSSMAWSPGSPRFSFLQIMCAVIRIVLYLEHSQDEHIRKWFAYLSA